MEYHKKAASMNPKPRRPNLILPILVAFALVGGGPAYLGYWSNVRDRWDTELTLLAARIERGTTQAKLEHKILVYCKQVPAKWITTDDKKSWIIRNPGRLGAQERVLDLEFDERGILQHRTLRTSDDPRRPPVDGPPDF